MDSSEELFVYLDRYLPKVLISIIHEYHPSLSFLLRQLVEPADYSTFLTLLQRLFYARYVSDIRHYLFIGDNAECVWNNIDECKLLQWDLRSCGVCGNEPGSFPVTDPIISFWDGNNVRPNFRLIDARESWEGLTLKKRYTVFGSIIRDPKFDGVTTIHVPDGDEDEMEKLSLYLFTERAKELKEFLLHI